MELGLLHLCLGSMHNDFHFSLGITGAELQYGSGSHYTGCSPTVDCVQVETSKGKDHCRVLQDLGHARPELCKTWAMQAQSYERPRPCKTRAVNAQSPGNLGNWTLAPSWAPVLLKYWNCGCRACPVGTFLPLCLGLPSLPMC